MSNLNQLDTVILCGGLGTRLRSEIGESPKVMADINGHPFLNILLQHLGRNGLKKIILCTGYRADVIENYYQKNSLGLNFEFSREGTPLGTGGGLKNARGLVKSNPFLVLNGDSFCAVELKMFLNFHLTNKADVSLALTRVMDKEGFGSVELGSDKRIKSFTEKAAQSQAVFVNAGVYLCDQKIFNLMPPQDAFSLEKDFFPNIVNHAFYGFETRAKLIDIGTPARYHEAKRLLR